MRLLTFEVWAPYAHFRRPYTTRSPATFSIPTRPSILGLLGAILGLDKKTYPEKLKDLKVGVKVNCKIRKIRTTINLVDTKGNRMIERTQMLYEFLSDPRYTIAIYTEDANLLSELFSRIKERRFYYTPYLGTAQHIAKVYKPNILETIKVDKTRTYYAAPVDAIVGVDKGKTYIIERQAYHIDANRKPTRYIDIGIPVNDPIMVQTTENVIVTKEGIVLW